MTAPRLRTVALALALLPLAAPALTAQVAPLRTGEVYRGSLQAGDTVDYAIDAEARVIMYGEVDQLTVDVVILLEDERGQTISRWDATDRGPDAFSVANMPDTPHLLRITGFEDAEGDYELRLLQFEPKSDEGAELADQIMFAYDRPGGPGGAIRVWRDGRTVHSEAYGLANLAYDLEFTEDTPTNIGSTSKQFTAFAVLLEQEAGRLSLEDPLSTYFPDFPDFADDITIRNLLTHTSGLREFLNLYILTGADTRSLDRDDVLRVVERQTGLQNEPGGEWNYNNTAFSLAAQIVEKTSGQDFDEYMRDHVFAPLGMNDSYVRMTPGQVIPGASEGYTRQAGWMARGDLGGAVGAGGIYASIADLERWGMNLLSPTLGTPEMIEEMTTSFVLNDGEETGYGLGLFIDDQRGLVRVHHGGADVSHRSMLVLYPEIDAGLTVQSNASTFDSNAAFELAEAFFGDAMKPEEEAVAGDFDPATFDPADFATFAGTYTLDPAPQIRARFWEEDGRYYTQLTNQPAVEMEPSGPNTFDLIPVEARVVFAEGDPAPGFTLFQNGQEVPGTRVEGDAGDGEDAGWAPTMEALEAFTGRFYSDEIETFYTIRFDEEQIEAGDETPRMLLNQLSLGDTPMRPTETDTFATAAGITLEFIRDRAGVVIGFYASNTRTRDIRFERVR